MLPDNTFSSEVLFALPEVSNPEPSLLESREWGGVALLNSNLGLRVKIWTCTLQGSNVVVYADDVPPSTVFTREDITELSLAFDQNMRPFITFVEAGVAKFYWYDSLIEDFRFTDLPAGSTSPRATLDDHRRTQLNTSDIILTYIEDGNLYYRQERDRYGVEYVLYPDINLAIISPVIQYVCMNEIGRLQWSVRGNFYGG